MAIRKLDIAISVLKRHDFRRVSIPADGPLVESIERDGLKNPIIIDEDLFVYSGNRRIDAYEWKRLNTIPAWQVKTLEDVLPLLEAEREYDVGKAPMSILELVEQGMSIEEFDDRLQKAILSNFMRNRHHTKDKLEHRRPRKYDRRRTIAKTLGLRHSNYINIKTLYLALRQDDPVRVVSAQKAIREIESGQTISEAYDHFLKRVKKEDNKDKFATWDKNSARYKQISLKETERVWRMLSTLESSSSGLEDVKLDVVFDSSTNQDLRNMNAILAESISVLRKFKNNMTKKQFTKGDNND